MVHVVYWFIYVDQCGACFVYVDKCGACFVKVD